MAQLERSGCPILGVVLNRVDGSKGGYYSKRYGNYGYYGNKYYKSGYTYTYSDKS
jgi:Mrp family chromosome partitioning ATPase